MSVAHKGVDFVELKSYNDFDEFVSGGPHFDGHESLGLDSLSDVVKTHVKAKALSFPRKTGDTPKRQAGVPEIDDYGVMGELTRKMLRKLIDQDKHVIVTSGLRIDRPDADAGQTEMLIGPDLAGQMFLGSTAMFDMVLCLKSRSVLKNPNDAKSRYTEYYYITNSPGNGIIAKNRLTVEDNAKSFLPQEVVLDRATGQGYFPWILEKAKDEYKRYIDTKNKV